ncbi:MAG: TolC family protein [Bacteroidota bacterium]
MNRYNFLLLLFFFPVANDTTAQKLLKLEEAITIALEDNYDLRISKNEVEIAAIENSTINSGYLPTVDATGGVSYANENQSASFNDGSDISISGAETESYNASITAEYTLFDGFERKHTVKQQGENLELEQLRNRQEIENTIVSIYETFYDVAFQSQVVTNLLVNIENSTDRLDRAKRGLKYGQGTKLDELNAQVDLNNDSISYASELSQLQNLKRSLNLLLGHAPNADIVVDTTVIFSAYLEEQQILDLAMANNVEMILANQNILLSELDIQINRAQFLPKITGNGSYRWNENQNPPTSFALTNETHGYNLGINLSWSIFDGGARRTRIETGRVNVLNRQIELEKVNAQVKTDIYNAHEIYKNNIFTLQAETKNVLTNQANFERTKRQYSLGQINAIDFRQAQVNLINAKNNRDRAKYDLKISEINLKQLAGLLLEK